MFDAHMKSQRKPEGLLLKLKWLLREKVHKLIIGISKKKKNKSQIQTNDNLKKKQQQYFSLKSLC